MDTTTPWTGRALPDRSLPVKLTGKTRYTADITSPGCLQAAVLTSPHAHARIKAIDTTAAEALPGVRAVLTGDDVPVTLGIYTGDKPSLAVGKVRHHGEPVAAVAADTLRAAREAAALITVEYEPLSPVRTAREALDPGAPLIHEHMEDYRHIDFILPEPGTNIANRTKIRKGDVEKALASSDAMVEGTFSLPLGDHAAMEVRAAVCEIFPDGRIDIISSTQAPFVVRGLISLYFGIPAGLITVTAPEVGGGFGGKAGIQLEGLAYLLSKAAGGRRVRLVNTREEDMLSSPGRVGLEAEVKLGAMADGTLTAADIVFYFDSGAYADYSVNVTRAAAVACTGPYRVPAVRCDSYCMYTTHPFATAYRGFGHIEASFAVERCMDLLAGRLGMDPVELRLKNAIRPGDTTPTGSLMDDSTGDRAGCLRKVAAAVDWDRGRRTELPGGRVRAKGVSCFWKAPAIPPNTDAGAVITFNEDGSCNLSTGIVDIGSGTKTALAQLAADVLGLTPAMVHVHTDVRTRTSPHDWTTAASRSLFMAGKAVLDAAAEAAGKIRRTAAIVFRTAPEEIELSGGMARVVGKPGREIPLSDLALGYVYPNGNAIEGQAIGTGRYITPGISGIDPDTGQGDPALEWTLGAEAAEVELDPADGAWRVIRLAGCIDAGKVVNPMLARGQFEGAMQMGIGFTMTEGFRFDRSERAVNGELRHFKLPRLGEQPEFHVDFLETPQAGGPAGARGMGEQGIIGVPGALANALSAAAGVPMNKLPLTPERVWGTLEGGRS